MQQTMFESIESYGLDLLTRVLGWEPARALLLLALTRKDVCNRDYHTYSNL